MSADTNARAVAALLDRTAAGGRPDDGEAVALAGCADLAALAACAAAIRDAGFGDLVTFARNVFIPLTRLCRDSCHYCTFARPPRVAGTAYLDPDEVMALAEAGRRAGCTEALFTLGDRPETRYRAARDELARLGHATTLDYVAAMAHRVLHETGLLPHLNPGVMSGEEIRRLRPVSASMGLMLESASERLARRGGPHFGSPDKQPARRIVSIAAAGKAAVPFTSGILVGIGETRAERIESLLALRRLADRHGHLQEIIVQNFAAKPGTRMADAPEPAFDELVWTVAVARILFGASVSIQVPPNLNPARLERLVAAGIDDWGGVSPVTPDHVNPEAPWPHLRGLEQATRRAGKTLVPRLAAHPRYVADAGRWFDAAVRPHVLRLSDADGHARPDDWAPGNAAPPPAPWSRRRPAPVRAAIERAIGRACDGQELTEEEIVTLFAARGDDVRHVCAAADRLRRAVCGDAVGYVVNRNITYTNICAFKCRFCAFSKGKLHEHLRGRPYDFDHAEIARRAREAWAQGATEVCIQGGIRPDYTGRHYLGIVEAVRAAVPDIHVHAFSPLEIRQGATTLGLDVRRYLAELREAGLGSLPGTAAEILDDEVRRVICPDKLSTDEWLSVVETAHELGIRTTATIMFGHVERPVHWARHLLRVRRLQARTGGITEFVPLPFVAAETPIFLKGGARAGPTLRETLLMHAVARLVLHPLVANVQASWVKLGPKGMRLCLEAGANDFGGTLMDERISRAAGGTHGQEMSPARIERAIRALGRTPWQRTTLYAAAPAERREAARCAYRGRSADGRPAAPVPAAVAAE